MKKFAILILALLCALFTFSACNDDEGETFTVYYTVTFVQEGQPDIVKRVKEGQSITEVSPPKSVVGYTDVRWDRTDFTNITQNITVNVLKTPKTYTITLDANGGVFENGQTTMQVSGVTFGESCYNLPYPQREGFYSRGYFYNGVEIGENQFNWQIDDENAVLTATWGKGEKNTYFRFNTSVWNLVSLEADVANDMSAGVSTIKREIYNGELPVLPQLEPVNGSMLGLEFQGWECNGVKVNDGAWTLYKENEIVVLEPIIFRTEVTFVFKHTGDYADWQLYDAMGATIQTSIENGVKISQCTVEYEYGQSVSILPVVCDKTYMQTGYGAYFGRWKFEGGVLFVDDAISATTENLMVNGRYWGVKDSKITVDVDFSKGYEVILPNV